MIEAVRWVDSKLYYLADELAVVAPEELESFFNLDELIEDSTCVKAGLDVRLICVAKSVDEAFNDVLLLSHQDCVHYLCFLSLVGVNACIHGLSIACGFLVRTFQVDMSCLRLWMGGD